MTHGRETVLTLAVQTVCAYLFALHLSPKHDPGPHYITCCTNTKHADKMPELGMI